MSAAAVVQPRVNTVSRDEWIADITGINGAPTNQQLFLPTNGGLIPNDRFMWGLLLQFEGRYTVNGGAAATSALADAPFSLINEVIVQGYHRLRGAQEKFIDVRGPDLRELSLIYNRRAPYNQNALNLSGATDLRFFIPVPFVPLGISLKQQIQYLLDAPNYDQLKLQINLADDKSLFNFSTYVAGAWTAFGSGGGTPRIRVVGTFAQAGKTQFAGFVPARTWRYYQDDTSTDITSTTNKAQPFQLPRGYTIRSLMLKSGVLSTTQTGSNVAYNTLSWSILQNLYIMRGTNKLVRFYADQYELMESMAEIYGITPDTGYGLFDFAPRGTVHERLDATSLVAGPTGDVQLFLQADTTGAANQALTAIYEEIRGQAVQAS